MGWIDTIVVAIVIFAGLAIFYRALKEPIDKAFYWVKIGVMGAVDGIKNAGGSAKDTTQTITYG